MTPAQKPGFGRPGSITAETLLALPPQMQAEGLRLLAEMGETAWAIRRLTGLGPVEINHLLRGPLPPYRLPDAMGEA